MQFLSESLPGPFQSAEILNEKIKVSSNDTTSDYLCNKLIAGDNIVIVEQDDGGEERMVISSSAGGGGGDFGGYEVACSSESEPYMMQRACHRKESNSVWYAQFSIPWAGTTEMGTPTKAVFMAWMDDSGKSGKVRIRDIDNNETIAQVVVDDENQQYWVDSSINNLSSGSAVWEVQMKSDSGEIRLGNVRLA